MLWKLLGGLALALIAAVVIDEIITRQKIKETMSKHSIKKGIINMINHSTNTVKLKDFFSDRVLEIRGDKVSDEISEGDVIYA
ncbi:MAG: hypothetical protein IJU32_04650 [Pyramidobacter sp.]|nr:hypothetical protein [Pyramidobacter sp.]